MKADRLGGRRKVSKGAGIHLSPPEQNVILGRSGNWLHAGDVALIALLSSPESTVLHYKE